MYLFLSYTDTIYELDILVVIVINGQQVLEFGLSGKIALLISIFTSCKTRERTTDRRREMTLLKLNVRFVVECVS
jgi:hypothetical protein